MKKIFKILLVSAFASTALMSCERVAPNYQGVLMQDYGKNGKTDFTLVKGRVATWQWGSELFQVPLFEQRAKFESPLKLKAADNTAFTSNPSYSYRVIESRAVDVVFDNKQINNGEDFMKSLEDNILESKIYDIMKESSRFYPTDSLMANGGSLKFERHVEKLVTQEFEKRGLMLVTFSSQLEFSQKVTEKIDSRNEVNTNITVLNQQLDEQRKRNELEALRAEASVIRSRGLTPEILQAQAIEKWDGVLPATWSGSNLPFVKAVK